MLIRTDILKPWQGERLADGILYPVNIEQVWTPADLAAIGLVSRTPFVVADGFRTVGAASYAVDGAETFATEAIPPPTAQEISDKKDATTAQFDNVDSLTRAAVLVVNDELNRHGAWEAGLTAAIAAATSLANLQTRVAAITPVAQKTPAQIKTAIRAKLGNGA